MGALGFKGETIVVASADTGVRWTHNALKPHYRGWDGVNANHNFNWHDSIHDSVGNPCGNDSQQPCDDYFHGSHTIGTAVGDDGGVNQIGMAPGAKWIACRNMDQGDGTSARYIECMEFFLAPYPLNCTPNEGDPTKAPDITINSWGCPVPEGCVVGDELQAAVEAQAAAGIQMVVAVGNSGSACSTVSDPPSFYAASYTVGALNCCVDTIAGFSSRGPITRDGSGRIKPDITAPGTNTRSACNSSDTCYTTAQGTSIATPNIAGAIALLWSAIPSLRHQIQASRDALNNSAVFISSKQCGDARGPAKQRLWLGASRHRSCSGNSVSNTDSHAKSYANSNTYGDSVRSDGNTNTDGNTYRATSSYTECNANPDASICSNAESASDSASQADSLISNDW
jgi:serine protease AprX